ncbi:MAG: histidine kinase [Lysobacteraceae bacterium]|nr:MAG: histidine kinase [Xanthomonadaceae bacterium]
MKTARSFATELAVRVGLLTICLLGLAVATIKPGYYALAVVMLLLSVLQVIGLYQSVARSNRELQRFFEAARHQDHGQGFRLASQGAGFEDLAVQLSQVMAASQQSRTKAEESLKRASSLIDQVPVPLLSLYQDGKVRLHNHAARHLFGRVQVQHTDDLEVFGQPFVDALSSITAGRRQLVAMADDGYERQLTVSATQLTTGSDTEQLISLQDIQSELDDVQLQSWQDLVRVLTHEIMNSITPVASLANTTADLVDDVQAKLRSENDANPISAELDDVRAAVETVARRSDGLMQFVETYRSLIQLPKPQKKPVPVSELIDKATALACTDWPELGIQLAIDIKPVELTVHADGSLLEQVLINLLGNAEQALEVTDNPCVSLSARVNQRGHAVIVVSDNGPGVAESIRKSIFVPFFTTRAQGSGVGLALTRQVMIAHGGSATVGSSASGGASFTLLF